MFVIWFLDPLPFLNPAWTSGNSCFTSCWSLGWRILSITLLACEMKWKSLSHVQLFATPWTIHSMEFSRPEYWSGQPFHSPEDFSNPGIQPRSTTLQADSLPAEPQGSPRKQEWVAYPPGGWMPGLVCCPQRKWPVSPALLACSPGWQVCDGGRPLVPSWTHHGRLAILTTGGAGRPDRGDHLPPLTFWVSCWLACQMRAIVQ